MLWHHVALSPLQHEVCGHRGLGFRVRVTSRAPTVDCSPAMPGNALGLQRTQLAAAPAGLRGPGADPECNFLLAFSFTSYLAEGGGLLGVDLALRRTRLTVQLLQSLPRCNRRGLGARCAPITHDYRLCMPACIPLNALISNTQHLACGQAADNRVPKLLTADLARLQLYGDIRKPGNLR